MQVAIYSRVIDYERPLEVQELFTELANHKIKPVLFQPFVEKIRQSIQLPENIDVFTESKDLDESIDFMISLGGDGTLLDTVTMIRNKNIPILGINFGRLGFLASIGKEDLSTAVTALRHRTFLIDKRSLIHLDASESLWRCSVRVK